MLCTALRAIATEWQDPGSEMVPLQKVLTGEWTVDVDLSGWFRIIRHEHRATPTGVTVTATRFSSPDDAFTILYVAKTLETALAETIERHIPKTDGGRQAAWRAGWAVASISSITTLRLADLRTDPSSHDARWLGLIFGSNQSHARHLSKAIHDRSCLDGIYYTSRLTEGSCAAIFGRSIDTKLMALVPVRPLVNCHDFDESLLVPRRRPGERSAG